MSESRDRYSWGTNVFLLVLSLGIVFFGYQQYGQQREGVMLSENAKQEIAKAATKEFADNKDIFISEVVTQVTASLKEELEKPKPNEAPDYQALSGLNKLEIVKSFESWTPNARRTDAKTDFSIILQDGELSQAYLYVKASKKLKPLTSYESIYLKFNNEGGHLFRPQSLPIPEANQEAGKTVLLYSFQDLPYLPAVPYSEQRVPDHTNLFDIFKNGQRVNVIAFISSLEPAVIEEVTIHYGCKEGSPCRLTLD